MKTKSPSNVNCSWPRHFGAAWLTAVLLVVTATNALAQLIAYDSMSYSGTQVNAGTAAPSGTPTQTTSGGFTGNWAAAAALTWNSFGLAYPGLPVTGGSLQNLGANNDYEQVASAPNSGSVWVGFLFRFNGTPGGNRNGIMIEDSTGSGVMFSYHQNSATQAYPCLVPMSSITTKGTEFSTKSSTLKTVANTNLYVLQFTYTAGVVSRIDVYSDPTANQGTAPSPDFSITAGLPTMGAIGIVGMDDSNADPLQYDEVRVGNAFGDVVGYNPPAVPTGLTATPGINQVGLSWNAVSGATGYNVLRGTSSGGETLLASDATTNYNDITAVGGTTYYYEVQATNASGASAASSEVFATPTIALPSVPTGVTAVGTNSAVSVSWSVATGALSYNVKRSTTSGGEATIANVSTPSYYDTAVANGTTYYYEVSSTNNAGESANSSEVSATPNVPPVAPTALVTTAGNNQVSLSWTGSAGATSYNIKRATTSGAEVTIASSGTASYVDSTAIKFTEYYYEVSAVNADGESTNSNETTATPTGVYGPTAYEPFNYPTGTFANNTPSTATGFTGNWTIPQGATITTGQTYAGLTTTDNSYVQAPTGFQNYEDLANPLSGGTAYISFLIKGNGNPGAVTSGIYLPGNNANSLFCGFEGGYSPSQTSFGLGSVSSTTLGSSSPLGSTTPVNNTGVQLIVLEINFNTSGNNDTVSLWINPPVGVITPGVAANTVISNFDVGTISGFGINSQGAYALGIDEIQVGQVYGDVVGYVPPPTAPTGVTAIPGVNQVGLSWNSVSGATGYDVLRGTSSGGETLLTSLPGTNYNDITAVGGTTYYYEVQATNATGASVVSSEVSATPTIALPDVPTGLSAIGTNGAVSVSWSVATGATAYNVKRSTTSGGETTIASVSTPSYYDTAVANGTTYYYEVSSTNNAGESGNSSEVNATPNLPPVAPTALVATAGTNQVSLSWTGSAGATSYNIKRSTMSGAEVTIASSGTASYLDATAIKFTQYYYEVSAVDSDGESTNSNEATATPTGVYGPVAYEPFNYPTGGFANNTPSTGTGFTGNWTIPTGASITTGLTYAGLTTIDNAYLQTASGFQNYENLASPLASGTAFISFLFKGAGDPGANPAGIYLPGNNATSLFCGFEGADNGVDNYFGLGSVNSSTLGGSTILGTTTPISNTDVHLIVLEIDFNTSGTNDTISLWIDPPVGVTTPGVAANAMVSSFDVGTISGFGYNVAGAYGMVIDEIKIGQVYGDVVGYSLTPAINPNPTTITTSLSGNQLTLMWPSDHTGWTLQAQTNSLSVGLSTNWSNVPGSTTTNQVTVTVDPTQPTVFYQLEYTP